MPLHDCLSLPSSVFVHLKGAMMKSRSPPSAWVDGTDAITWATATACGDRLSNSRKQLELGRQKRTKMQQYTRHMISQLLFTHNNHKASGEVSVKRPPKFQQTCFTYNRY